MASGVYIHGQCIASADYPAYTLGYMTPASAVSGGDTYSWWYSISGSNIAQTTIKNGVFYQYSQLFSTPTSNCDTATTFTDGLTLGWAVVAAMVAAYAIHLFRRAI